MPMKQIRNCSMKNTIDKCIFATTSNHGLHYMGVDGEAKICEAAEQHYSDWLRPENEDELIDYLSGRLEVLGRKE